MTGNDLRQRVTNANRALAASGVVTLTWGNASAIDRDAGRILIKPSGVAYEDLGPEDMVTVDLDGRVVEGKWNPSSDTATHAALYRAFPGVGGIVHTHSAYATMFAQACREIPCLGTTHADQFPGPVPLARALTADEVRDDYEGHTGTVIAERFKDRDPLQMPAVLVAHHGPFTWGQTVEKAVEQSIALEAVAQMAWGTLALEPQRPPIPVHILEKHFSRKHGPDATYGQR